MPRRVLQARVKLMLAEPYLASAIARYPVVDATTTGWCGTMATDGYYIYVNRGFCETLSDGDIGFVFAHEVMHCVLRHIDRRGNRDRRLWNEAIDYATNGLLVDCGLTMPEGGLFDRRFERMTAEDIYRMLEEEGKESARSRQGEGGRGSAQGIGSPADSGAAGGWDLHLSPDDVRGSSFRAREFPSLEERRQISTSLEQSIRAALSGTTRGWWESEVSKAGVSEVPWRSILSRFFSGIQRDDYRLFPPNLKHLWRGIYLPSLGVPGPDHVVVAVDTSASMGDPLLARVLTELDRLTAVAQCDLTLIQCDAEIQQVETFDSSSAVSFERYRFRGRDGTSFVPVFDWVRHRESSQAFFRIDALFYLTDGRGSFPEEAPRYPVLWISPAGCQSRWPFGEVLRISDD